MRYTTPTTTVLREGRKVFSEVFCIIKFLVPWLGVQSSSCFAHQHCPAKYILRSRKIVEISMMGRYSCDLIGRCLHDMLSIALIIRV